MKRISTSLAAVLLLLTTAGTSATSTTPSPAASSTIKDGEPWIVYEGPVPEANSVGNRLIRPDGSDEQWATADAPITTDPGGSGGGIGDGWQLHPDWSPDGQELAFPAVASRGPACLHRGRVDRGGRLRARYRRDHGATAPLRAIPTDRLRERGAGGLLAGHAPARQRRDTAGLPPGRTADDRSRLAGRCSRRMACDRTHQR